jgi:hypothetical protein
VFGVQLGGVLCEDGEQEGEDVEKSEKKERHRQPHIREGESRSPILLKRNSEEDQISQQGSKEGDTHLLRTEHIPKCFAF